MRSDRKNSGQERTPLYPPPKEIGLAGKKDKMQVEYRFVKIDKESEQIRIEVINQIVCKVIRRKLRQPASEEQMSDKIFRES